MQFPRSIALAVLLAFTSVASGQAQSARSHFELGARAYLSDGASAAITAWLKGSALEGNPQATSQANTLRQIEDFYGKAESYEVISESVVSPKTTLVLAVINYQKGPLFARFQTYKLTSGAWVATEFKFHTEAAQIFPNSALYGR
jgi:hypothetical protein